jgi:hypothetical protein
MKMTTELLEKYAAIEDEIEFMQNAKSMEQDQAIPDEVKAKLRAIEDHYSAQIEETQKRLSELKGVITEQVLKLGKTVPGTRVMAVWNKGKTTWDGKLLSGFALAHPEVNACKKIGSPTVSFRKVK